MEYLYGDQGGLAIVVGAANDWGSRDGSVDWGRNGRSVCCVMAEVVGVVHHYTEGGHCVSHCQAARASMCQEAWTRPKVGP